MHDRHHVHCGLRRYLSRNFDWKVGNIWCYILKAMPELKVVPNHVPGGWTRHVHHSYPGGDDASRRQTQIWWGLQGTEREIESADLFMKDWKFCGQLTCFPPFVYRTSEGRPLSSCRATSPSRPSLASCRTSTTRTGRRSTWRNPTTTLITTSNSGVMTSYS